MVFARRHNQFAPFIAVGFLSGYRFTKVQNSITATGLQNRTLTVARRYLDDGDERCGWSMDDLEREVREAMASSVPTHPWMVECMGARSGRNASDETASDEKPRSSRYTIHLRHTLRLTVVTARALHRHVRVHLGLRRSTSAFPSASSTRPAD